MNWKNILSRAAWTFVQGALVAIPATLAIADLAEWKEILAGMALAGIMAVLSFVKTTAQEALSKSG